MSMELDVSDLYSSILFFIVPSSSVFDIINLLLILLVVLIFQVFFHKFLLMKKVACLVHPVFMYSV